MLEGDSLVRHNVCPVEKMGDIVPYVNKSLDCNVTTASEALLVLAAYCLYITHEEIGLTFPHNNSDLLSRTLSSLTDKGLLTKMPLTSYIGVSRSCFRITSSGFKMASELKGGLLPNKYKSLPRGKTGAISSLSEQNIRHTYLVGYNLFSVLSLKLPVEWRREYPYTYGTGYTGTRKKGDLIMDARCSLFPDERKGGYFYFEEDTGAENATILLNKLSKYYEHHLMDGVKASNAVVFSFFDTSAHAPKNMPGMPVSPYSTPRCKALLKVMTERNVEDAILLLGDSSVDQEYLRALLLLTGSGVMDGNSLVRGRVTLSSDMVSEFYNGLLSRRNLYQTRDFNRLHSSLAFRRMVRMAVFLLSDLGNLPLYAERMGGGFPVYCMPTPLVSDRLPFCILPHMPFLMDAIKRTLSPYFSGVTYRSEVSEPLTVSRRGNMIRLRNVFSYDLSDGKQGYVAIEYISFDLSAWIRAALFMNYMGSYSKEPYQFICVFESKEHCKRFCDTVKIPSGMNRIVPDSCGVFGLMLGDIGKKKTLFAIGVEK